MQRNLGIRKCVVIKLRPIHFLKPRKHGRHLVNKLDEQLLEEFVFYSVYLFKYLYTNEDVIKLIRVDNNSLMTLYHHYRNELF